MNVSIFLDEFDMFTEHPDVVDLCFISVDGVEKVRSGCLGVCRPILHRSFLAQRQCPNKLAEFTEPRVVLTSSCKGCRNRSRVRG